MIPEPYFENDGVTLYLGDCREILPELQSESFDMVVPCSMSLRYQFLKSSLME